MFAALCRRARCACCMCRQSEWAAAACEMRSRPCYPCRWSASTRLTASQSGVTTLGVLRRLGPNTLRKAHIAAVHSVRPLTQAKRHMTSLIIAMHYKSVICGSVCPGSLDTTPGCIVQVGVLVIRLSSAGACAQLQRAGALWPRLLVPGNRSCDVIALPS